jgi:hypothetical protein
MLVAISRQVWGTETCPRIHSRISRASFPALTYCSGTRTSLAST